MTDRTRSLGPRDGYCYWPCGRRANSREHLIPRWIEKAFELPEGWLIADQPTLRTTREGITTERRVQRLASKWLTTPSVCTDCNNGWMSDIENATKDLLTPMIRGRRTPLDPQSQLEIALWASMKACVADARPGADHGGLGSESIRAAIYGRHEVPVDMTVRLAAFDEPHLFAMYTSFGIGSGSAEQHLAQWVTTFALGHLLVQVAARTGTVLPGVIEQLPGGTRDERSFTVWPTQFRTISWPPPVVFDRGTLGPFLTQLCPEAPPIDPWDGEQASTCGLCGDAHGRLTRVVPTDD